MLESVNDVIRVFLLLMGVWVIVTMIGTLLAERMEAQEDDTK